MKPIEKIAVIRAKRTNAGISQAALAEAAGLSADILVRLESGRHVNPTHKTLEALEAAITKLLKPKPHSQKPRSKVSVGEKASV